MIEIFHRRVWHRLAEDNSTWRELFAKRQLDGWEVDLRRAGTTTSGGSLTASRVMLAPLQVDWYNMYKMRTELDRRWFSDPGTSVNMRLSAQSRFETRDGNNSVWIPSIKKLSGHADR